MKYTVIINTIKNEGTIKELGHHVVARNVEHKLSDIFTQVQSIIELKEMKDGALD